MTSVTLDTLQLIWLERWGRTFIANIVGHTLNEETNTKHILES
jgi:hypothetical protein